MAQIRHSWAFQRFSLRNKKEGTSFLHFDIAFMTARDAASREDECSRRGQEERFGNTVRLALPGCRKSPCTTSNEMLWGVLGMLHVHRCWLRFAVLAPRKHLLQTRMANTQYRLENPASKKRKSPPQNGLWLTFYWTSEAK